MSFIETENVWQKREGRDILKNINVRIDRGQVFALIGPTGAGKTTLLRLIDMLDKPAAGRILFNDVDVTSSERARLAARRPWLSCSRNRWFSIRVFMKTWLTA